ncbi:MAG TPA: TadE/TadG family type IV pilus assembly protein [Azospira sp.]|nr:TadE/TadG family type IV pilus assembly protein [Azospira sp.]
MNSRSAKNHQKGAAAVELAFLLVLLLLMAAGTFEFGRAFWYYNALAKATRDGARALSLEPKETIASVGVGAAKALVVSVANDANLSPALTLTDVAVTCDGGACADNTAPAEVRVDISGYTIDIGGVFPFFTPDTYKIRTFSGVPLAPHTTMPYMVN